MPSPEYINLVHTAVVFAKRSGRSGFDSFGRPIVDAQEEVCCRIEYTTAESKATDNASEQTIARMFVCQDVPVGSIVWDGKASQLPEDLAELTNLMQVSSVVTTPDIKYRDTQRTLTLSRYHNKIPTIGT